MPAKNETGSTSRTPGGVAQIKKRTSLYTLRDEDEELSFTIERSRLREKLNVYDEEFNEAEADLSLHSRRKIENSRRNKVSAGEQTVGIECEVSFE